MSGISNIEKEIKKFLKKIKTTSPKEQVELHNIIGGLYSDIGLYDEAKNHHEKALDLCKGLGDSLGVAIAYRHIGEARAACGSFDEAIEDVTRYLQLVQKCNNEIEVQRALTTLGRVQLMQAQHMKDERYYHSNIKRVAVRAEKTFQKALTQTRDIKRQVDIKEFYQMYAGLLVNMALVKELCGKREETLEILLEARDIYKTSRLRDELFRCLILLTSISRQAKDFPKASVFAKEALDVAKGTGKKLYICEALLELGLFHMTLRQFKEAKRAFKMAHREGSPNEDDQEKAIRYRKICHLISTTFSKLEQHDLDSAARAKYAERLGDLFCKLDCYCQSIVYYALALDRARVCLKPPNELAKILYSLAETYYDDGQLEKALKCYEKEVTWSRGDKARCQTLFRIAQVLDQLNRAQPDVCEAYEKSLAKSDSYMSLKVSILDNYIAYTKEKHCNVARYNELVKLKEAVDDYLDASDAMEDERVSTMSQGDNDGDEESDLEDEIAQLNVDDFVSDEDDDDEVCMLSRRRGNNKGKFKTNEFGETPLHEAIIRGDTKRVKQLLDQGHDVNPKDNLGWTPLHEACNFGHLEIAKMLVEKGAEVSDCGPKGMTPLHDAAANGHFDVMRLLMKNNANVVALTANGESVLKCLRDYRRRYTGKLSNNALSDYKEIETDLIDMMDKRGFDLIAANKEEQQAANSKKPIQSITDNHRHRAQLPPPPQQIHSHINQQRGSIQRHQKQQQQPRPIQNDQTQMPRPKPKPNLAALEIETEIVRDYRATLGQLKRKHRSPEVESDLATSKKINPEVTYEPDYNPSTSTKDWLIDDITKPSLKPHQRHQVIDVDYDDDDDDDDDARGQRRQSDFERLEREEEGEEEGRESDIEVLNVNVDQIVDLIGTQEEEKENENDCAKVIEVNKQQQKRDKSLVYVHIEDRKLLIQLPNCDTNIKWLKQAVVERYEALVAARPIISVAPMDEPDCIVSDNDTCELFLNSHVLVTIISWELDTPEATYKLACAKVKPSVKPLLFITRNLAAPEISHNLDLTFSRLPNSHIEPFCQAMARRSYNSVKLNGTSCLFRSNYADILLNTVFSWYKLVYLELRCVGLLKSHFESLCSKLKLKNIKTMNLSHNCIMYKCKDHFKRDVEKLLVHNPNIKRIDLSRNQLKFVSSLPIEQTNAMIDGKQHNINITIPIGLPNRFAHLELIANAQVDQYSVFQMEY